MQVSAEDLASSLHELRLQVGLSVYVELWDELYEVDVGKLETTLNHPKLLNPEPETLSLKGLKPDPRAETAIT